VVEQVIFYARPASGSFDPWTRLNRWLAVALAWQKRYTERQALRDLDDRLLNDIGLTRAQAEAESAKPFWRY
jgi:uncharacterized protein YjiS (DUF1127 family)